MNLNSKHLDRFWSRVALRQFGCWEWQAYCDKKGYGIFRVFGKCVKAHRFAYETIKEEIPINLVIDHICCNRTCVNPDHLQVVSNKTNILRGAGRAAFNAHKTHCIRGHELTSANINQRRFLKDGRRDCLQCEKLRKQLDYKKNKESIQARLLGYREANLKLVKERAAARGRDFYKNNKERCLENQRKRRANARAIQGDAAPARSVK